MMYTNIPYNVEIAFIRADLSILISDRLTSAAYRRTRCV